MSGDVHARFCESLGVRFPRATRLLACFEYQSDADRFRASLGERMEKFQLELAEEKTRHLEFGRYARAKAYRSGDKPREFDFLGMTFFCGKTRYGSFKVKRKTSRKKLRQSLARFTDWIRRYRNLMPSGELLRRAKARVNGPMNPFCPIRMFG